MTNKELAQKLLDLLGGKDNVLANAACMTRLRVTVKDTGNVDTEGIKALDGVMGLVEDDTMQIVLGPGKVNKVLEEFSKLTGLAKGVADESVVDAAATNKAAQKAKYESKPVQAFLKKISNVFVALLPGIIAAGLINGICNVINVSTAGALAGEWWYQGIRSMGWALFAYLPILVGYNAAREFGGSAALGGIAGMMCIANSAMPLLAPGAADPAAHQCAVQPRSGRHDRGSHRWCIFRLDGASDSQGHAQRARYVPVPAAGAHHRRLCSDACHPAGWRLADGRDL